MYNGSINFINIVPILYIYIQMKKNWNECIGVCKMIGTLPSIVNFTWLLILFFVLYLVDLMYSIHEG